MSDATPHARDDASYALLIDGLCALCRVPASPQRHQRCELTVDGTHLTLLPATQAGQSADGLVYFAEVAPIDPEHRPATAIGLLEANIFLVGRESPKFCLHPVSGQVILSGYLALDRHAPDSAHRFFVGLARLVEQFRDSEMLKPAGPPGPPQGMRGGTPIRRA